jgi:DNA-binding MarR family transcriptional regulator
MSYPKIREQVRRWSVIAPESCQVFSDHVSVAELPVFVLTNYPGVPTFGAMNIDHAVRVVQVAYPQVYLACHTRHQRKRSTAHRLSARDASILAHLDERLPITPARLAAHLGIGRSTLSEALKRLERLGYVGRPNEAGSAGRRMSVLLTPRGAGAIGDTSVLETPRLRAVLGGASERERTLIVAGMDALARACRRAAESRDGARRALGGSAR